MVEPRGAGVRPCRRQRNAEGGATSGGPRNKNGKSLQVNKKLIVAADSGNGYTLLSVIEEHLPYMNLVNLSTSIHRLAKFAILDKMFHCQLLESSAFKALQKTIHSRLAMAQDEAYLHQSLSNITWSLAHLGVMELTLLQLLATLSAARVPGFKPFELSTLLWAFAKLGVFDSLRDEMAALFRMASDHLIQNFKEFNFRGLATVAWAFATARQRNSHLFSGLAREMCRSATTANCQEISNSVWAFATAGHKDRKLQAALAQAALPLMDSFKAQEISNLLWGLATTNFWQEEVFVQCLAQAQKMQSVLGPQHLANILWACAKVMPKHTVMVDAIVWSAPVCIERMATFKHQEISSTLQALARVLLTDEDEEAALARAKLPDRPSLPKEVVDLVCSMAQWVACNSSQLASPPFTSAVSHLLMLGVRVDCPVNLIVEPAVADRLDIFVPAEKVMLLRAFLCATGGLVRSIGRAVPLLAAGLTNSIQFLQSRDFQALSRAFLTSHRASTDAPSPTAEELCHWCLVLAADMGSVPWDLTPSPPELEDKIWEDDSEALDALFIERNTKCASWDGAYTGSEFCIQTAESLPYLDWHERE